MKVEKYIPTDILKPYIKTFMIIESNEGMQNKILPDTSIVLAFRLRGNVTSFENNLENTLPSSAITGIKRSTRLLLYSEHTATLLVIFNEGKAAAFFHEPLHELSELSISLDNFVDLSKLSRVEEQLAEAKNNLQRIAIAEWFLISELKQLQSDRLILHAVKKIKMAHGDIQIRNLSKELYVSHDSFEKRFRRIIGTTPKQYAKIIRFRNLINSWSQSHRLTDLAYTAGYFDQAHFIKDFRSFTGQSPQDFFKSSRYW